MRLQTPAWLVGGLALLLSVAGALGQGTFQNLGFEDADLAPVPPGQYGGAVSISNALPHWNGYLGTDGITYAVQNNLSLGAAGISILGPDWEFNDIIEGQYTPVLQAGQNSEGTANVDVSLSQVSLVPASAQSLQLKVFGFNFLVTLAGQPISLQPIGSGPNYVLYEGDISQFAGKVADLRLVAQTTSSVPFNAVFFDSIVFSNLPVPEPGVFGLCAVGALLLGWRLLRQR